MCVSVVACLAIGFVPVGNEFGLHRFFSFMPYFMFGHYYGQKMLQAIDNKVINLPPPIRKNTETIIMFGIYGSNGRRVIQPALA